mgnify:CR=1 FL=1
MTKLSESFYLTLCIIVNFIATYWVAGIDATLWSSLATLHSYTIFNKANRYKNIFYSLLCSLFIFISSALGYYFGIGLLFFSFLFIVSLSNFEHNSLLCKYHIPVQYINATRFQQNNPHSLEITHPFNIKILH